MTWRKPLLGRVTLAVGVGVALLSGGALASVSEASERDARATTRRPIGTVDSIQEGPDPTEIFKRQCATCHGKEGEGDGPAAMAMNPRPADLTDPERIGELSDEELVEVLTEGRAAMPSFGSLLEPEQVRAMVSYIRELSGTESEP